MKNKYLGILTAILVLALVAWKMSPALADDSYTGPAAGSVCAGLSLEMNAARRPIDESTPCQPDDPSNPMCRDGNHWPYIRINCEYSPNPRYPNDPWDCVYEWWCGPIPKLDEVRTNGIGYVTIIGSAKASWLIAKQWDGNSWQFPQYMGPAAVGPGEPVYWYAKYILGPGPARFGLFGRGVSHGQDQVPLWTIEVEIAPGEAIKIVAKDEDLNFQ